MSKYSQSQKSAESARISIMGTEEKLTLRQLRARISSTKGIRHTPTAKSLRNSAELIVRREVRDAVVEVYSNGFAVYQKPCHQAVLRMEYVGKAKYEEYDSERDLVRTNFYDLEDMDWSIAVMMTGEDRMDLRYDEKMARTTVSMTGTGYREDEDSESDDMEFDAGVDVQKEVIDAIDNEEAETLQRRLAGLTDRQREIAEMYYIKGMTQQEIADVLGIKQQVVDRHLKAGMKKLKKFSEKF